MVWGTYSIFKYLDPYGVSVGCAAVPHIMVPYSCLEERASW